MYRLSTQFDSRSKRVEETAAGGGSCTTTSSCVVTAVAVSTFAAGHFAGIARKVHQSMPQDAKSLPGTSPGGWGLFGFFLLPLAIGVGFLTAPMAIVTAPLSYVGGFAVAYGQLRKPMVAGLFVGLLSLFVVVCVSAAEAMLWLTAK